ncbi:unnamed protein product [Ilex paraguariensis]|uniref:BAR domain-containing protein n=1 Tax=Ilex paraguariensis TaxID=185542 RepID=A0ABC8RI24_9AQUA
MKTSLKKLRGLAHHMHEKRERHVQPSKAQLDELAQASQDMEDMRDCYDSLLSAAAATANCAYEFSESLREMGDCLLEKTALNDDEESGKVLLMLGKVQFELQKLVDSYRSHIFQTITIPSESLLNELRIVEEMKRQCDEKRDIYESMITRHREKGRLRSSKGERFSSHQLEQAHEAYDEEATFFVFRMKSLKRGQSHSLLTQAARHHASQLCFFRKALKSLEAIEPHVKSVTEQQHIDYHFTGLEDDDKDGSNSYDDDYDDEDDEDEDDTDSGDEECDDGELSFGYGQKDQGQDLSISRNSMELEHVDLTFPHVASIDAAKENLVGTPGGNYFDPQRELKESSKSAPLFAEKKFDPAEKPRQLWPYSSRKFHTYVLPTPVETKSPVSVKSDAQILQTKQRQTSGRMQNLWHSTPLEQKKYQQILGNEKLSGPIILNTESVLKESNNNTKPCRLPPPLTDRVSSVHLDIHAASVTKNPNRQAFSGPLTGKSWANKPILSASGPIASTGHSQPLSGSLLRTPLPRPSSTQKLSSSASPTFVSSPKISELHELPRPPAHLASNRPSYQIHHSAPLVSKFPELSATKKVVVFTAASTLPVPCHTIPRSYSIPSRDDREMPLNASKPLDAAHNSKLAEEIASPPLTPISLSDI